MADVSMKRLWEIENGRCRSWDSYHPVPAPGEVADMAAELIRLRELICEDSYIYGPNSILAKAVVVFPADEYKRIRALLGVKE